MRTALLTKQLTIKLAGSDAVFGTCRDADEAGVWIQVGGNIERAIKGLPTPAQGQALVMFIPFSQMAWLAVSISPTELQEQQH